MSGKTYFMPMRFSLPPAPCPSEELFVFRLDKAPFRGTITHTYQGVARKYGPTLAERPCRRGLVRHKLPKEEEAR